MKDCLDNCTGGLTVLTSQNNSLEQDFKLLEHIVCRQEQDIKLLKKHWTDLTARSMHENLLFHNLPETKKIQAENCEATVKTALHKLGIKVSGESLLQQIHRLGLYDPGQKFPRPIVAKLQYKQSKEILDQARKFPKTQETRITRQLPQEYRVRRSSMLKVAE